MQKPTNRPSVPYKLATPIRAADGSTIDEVHVVRPRAGEMRDMPVPTPGITLTTGQFYPAVARCCGLTLEEFEQLDASDAEVLSTLVMQASKRFPPTGPKPSPASADTSTSGEPSS